MNITGLRYNYYVKAGGYYSDNSLFAANAIFCVLTNFLLRTAPSLVLTLSCKRSLDCDFFNDMMEHMFQKWDKVDKLIQIVEVHRNSVQRVPGQRNRNLILVDSYQTFLEANITSYTREHNFNEYNYIFLQTSDKLMKRHLQKILEYCWANYIIHCSVQVQNMLGDVFVYTYFPYTVDYCGDVVPVIINQFNGSTFMEPEIFPKKLENLYQCPLQAAVWQIPPFMLLTTNGNTTNISGGIDGKLIVTLASLLNFTIDVKIPPRDEELGKFSGNTSTGAFRMLTDGSADFSLGGIRQTVERNEVASHTVSYFQSKTVFLALRSAYDLTSWEILMFPFNTYAWLLILFTLSLAVLKAFFANRLYQRCNSFFQNYNPENIYLNIFSTFIGVPATSMPCAFKARILFILWLFFSLVIRTLYQALLFHQIRTRVENNIPENFNQLADPKFTAVINEGVIESVRNLSVVKQMHKIVLNTTSKELNLRYIEEMQSEWFLAVNLVDFLIVYVNEYEKPGIFKILPQPLISYHTVIYMPKHSFLIDQFNEEIIWLKVAGFFELWTRAELDMEYYKENLSEERIYGWEELHMIFVIYGVGVIMACIVFILELISRRYLILRRVFHNIE